MFFYSLFRRLPNWALTVLGLGFVALGLYFERITVPCAWLFPLGLTAQGFYSGDYWPLLPNFGWFLLGAVLGRRLYPARRPLLPALQGKAPFLSFCGRHSLLLYLLQQPVTIALIGLVGLLLRYERAPGPPVRRRIFFHFWERLSSGRARQENIESRPLKINGRFLVRSAARR